MLMSKIIGKSIVAIKGYPTEDKRVKQYIEPAFILFDDNKTIVQLDEQDYHSYHDCSSSARSIYVLEDEKFWQSLFNNYPDANSDI